MDTTLWLSLVFSGIIIMIGSLWIGVIFIINGFYELGMVYLGGGAILGLIYGGYYCYFKLIERNEKD